MQEYLTPPEKILQVFSTYFLVYIAKMIGKQDRETSSGLVLYRLSHLVYLRQFLGS